LGRFANAFAGHPMKDNSMTNVFRDQFAKLRFRLIDSPEAEAEQAVERQRKLAEVFARPQQAKFRREVFALWGAHCLIKKCETLLALEATHIHRVSEGGNDQAWNGIPLRADVHRLFDAGLITLSSDNWTLSVNDDEAAHYGKFHGRSLAKGIGNSGKAEDLAAMLRKQNRCLVVWLTRAWAASSLPKDAKTHNRSFLHGLGLQKFCHSFMKMNGRARESIHWLTSVELEAHTKRKGSVDQQRAGVELLRVTDIAELVIALLLCLG